MTLLSYKGIEKWMIQKKNTKQTVQWVQYVYLWKMTTLYDKVQKQKLPFFEVAFFPFNVDKFNSNG